MEYKNIDAFEIRYADSFTDEPLKLKSTTGIGEVRIYVGNDEQLRDEFFEFGNIEYFFVLKKDLLRYLDDAKDEYLNKTQEYRHDISRIYDKRLDKIRSVHDDILRINFMKKFDSQKRYYIVLQKGKENRERYGYLRSICLPRITRLGLVKLEDPATRKRYVYIKPIFYINSLEREEKKIELEIAQKPEKQRREIRLKQDQYRFDLLDQMPFCAVTGVSESKILIACHIKPYAICEENEKYDKKNGIVLTPTYHALFDIGFISFENNGAMIVSPFLSNFNIKKLDIVRNKKCRLISGSQKYLRYHRENVFTKIDRDFKLTDMEPPD